MDAETKRSPWANRAYHPEGYDRWFSEGRAAAEAGLPRNTPKGGDYGFAFAYPAQCWYDGYDNIPNQET